MLESRLAGGARWLAPGGRRGRVAGAGAEVREACGFLDRLLQKRRFLREACKIMDRLHHPVPE